MKKIFVLSIFLAFVASCGVQRPYPPTISLTYGNPATQFGQDAAEGYVYGISAYSVYDVTLGWDVSQTGAQGVKIDIATDYRCDNVVLTRTIPTSCQTDQTCLPLTYAGAYYNRSLAHVFYGQSLAPLKAGGYYICISGVMYDSISSPSLPAYLYLMMDQYGTGY
ncbi:MAG: hypothetical protein V1647_02550 [Pseudomonadota bacterium]